MDNYRVRKFKSLVIEGLKFDCKIPHLTPQKNLTDEEGNPIMNEQHHFQIKQELTIQDVYDTTATSWKTPREWFEEQGNMPVINKTKLVLNTFPALVVYHDTTNERHGKKYCQGRHKNHFHVIIDYSDQPKKLSANPIYRQLKQAARGKEPKANISYQNVRSLARLIYYLKFDGEKIFLGSNNQWLLDFWNSVTEDLEIDQLEDLVGDVEEDDVSFQNLQKLPVEKRKEKEEAKPTEDEKTHINLGKIPLMQQVIDRQQILTSLLKKYPGTKSLAELILVVTDENIRKKLISIHHLSGANTTFTISQKIANQEIEKMTVLQLLQEVVDIDTSDYHTPLQTAEMIIGFLEANGIDPVVWFTVWRAVMKEKFPKKKGNSNHRRIKLWKNLNDKAVSAIATVSQTSSPENSVPAHFDSEPLRQLTVSKRQKPLLETNPGPSASKSIDAAKPPLKSIRSRQCNTTNQRISSISREFLHKTRHEHVTYRKGRKGCKHFD
ncbi:hypothetical protein PoB_001632300 [Plakobranchus ocellatus]|uniref:Uncharacterized protein n=1 Tax=Plakobranchus ocellatus TaxID=259542 RepID=A0AAV3Z579_9GAST|nr:hypothetical protein PoB_001632300 [Plakobranchus ocellatus]